VVAIVRPVRVVRHGLLGLLEGLRPGDEVGHGTRPGYKEETHAEARSVLKLPRPVLYVPVHKRAFRNRHPCGLSNLVSAKEQQHGRQSQACRNSGRRTDQHASGARNQVLERGVWREPPATTGCSERSWQLCPGSAGASREGVAVISRARTRTPVVNKCQQRRNNRVSASILKKPPRGTLQWLRDRTAANEQLLTGRLKHAPAASDLGCLLTSYLSSRLLRRVGIREHRNAGRTQDR